jgi:hypothetical protein
MYIMAVPWLRWLVAGLSPQKLRFAPRPVHVEFEVGQVPLPSFSVFSCQYRSTVALHAHISPGGVSNRPVGGRSSETQSHPIAMNNTVT